MKIKPGLLHFRIMVVRKKSITNLAPGEITGGESMAKEINQVARLENLKKQSADQINLLFDQLIGEVNALEELEKSRKI